MNLENRVAMGWAILEDQEEGTEAHAGEET